MQEQSIRNGYVYVDAKGVRRRTHQVSPTVLFREWKPGWSQPTVNDGWGWASINVASITNFALLAESEEDSELIPFHWSPLAHRLDCTVHYANSEQEAVAKNNFCTCVREASIQKKRLAGDPAWQ